MQYKTTYGLNRALEAVQLSKSTWYYARQRQPYEDKYSHLRKTLITIAKAHPEYGIDRTTSELHDSGIHINHKVIEKLHRYWGLAILKRVQRPKPGSVRLLLKETGSRINLVSSLEDIDDFEVLYTDFTEIVYRRGQAKAQLMPIIDHRSKLAVGHALGESADTELALKAWRKARITLRRYKQRLRGVIIHHDQDSVYTGHGWLHEVVVKDNVRVSYSENGAKGNVHMESFNGKFKTENHMLFWEQEDFESVEKVVKTRIRYYNQIHRHSALGNKSPIKYLKEKGKVPR
jgi:putative transposase